MTTTKLTRNEVLRVVSEARAEGKRPDLCGADLRGANLSSANLSNADLTDAGLSDADLSSADLRGANLTDAGLTDADLSGAGLGSANLAWATLSGANLSGADLTGANLSGADLTDANLTDADLRDANLLGAWWGGLATDGLHRYRCLLTPTPDGWVARIGCWVGTIPELRELIAGDDWPESDKEERERLRPLLRLWCDLAETHADSRPHAIPDLAKRWGES